MGGWCGWPRGHTISNHPAFMLGTQAGWPGGLLPAASNLGSQDCWASLTSVVGAWMGAGASVGIVRRHHIA